MCIIQRKYIYYKSSTLLKGKITFEKYLYDKDANKECLVETMDGTKTKAVLLPICMTQIRNKNQINLLISL